jgi:DNA-binding CsgD family transcriptional regulator/PAS domain-containing protein
MGDLHRLQSGPAIRRVASSPSANDPRDERTLTRLIAHIYDAALDAALWPDVLARIGVFLGGEGGGLLSKDVVSKAGTAHYTFGVDPHYVQLYNDTHSRCDPVATLPFFEAERIVSIPDLVPYEEFRRERFFQEWMRPQGLVDAANAVLEKSASSCSFITILRSEESGIVDDEMHRRMGLIVPHVRRAVLIGKAIEFKETEAAIFADMLNSLSAGLFLIAPDGRIVHANAAGHGMLDAGDILRSVHGRLATRDRQVDKVLHETFAASDNGDAGVGVKGIAVPLTAHDGDRYVAHILPLTSGERRHAAKTYTATAAMFVCKAAMQGPPVPEVIGKLYSLTPTELRVLLAIVEVGGIPEVAAAFGVADSTIRTHVGRLFDKTGTGRQADLVKLVAGFSSPLGV